MLARLLDGSRFHEFKAQVGWAPQRAKRVVSGHSTTACWVLGCLLSAPACSVQGAGGLGTTVQKAWSCWKPQQARLGWVDEPTQSAAPARAVPCSTAARWSPALAACTACLWGWWPTTVRARGLLHAVGFTLMRCYALPLPLEYDPCQPPCRASHLSDSVWPLRSLAAACTRCAAALGHARRHPAL